MCSILPAAGASAAQLTGDGDGPHERRARDRATGRSVPGTSENGLREDGGGPTATVASSRSCRAK